MSSIEIPTHNDIENIKKIVTEYMLKNGYSDVALKTIVCHDEYVGLTFSHSCVCDKCNKAFTMKTLCVNWFPHINLLGLNDSHLCDFANDWQPVWISVDRKNKRKIKT